MNFFDKIRGKKHKKKEGKSSSGNEERGRYMPAPETPTDDKFIMNFKENGGKFLYCVDREDLYRTFREVLKENNWQEQEVCCFRDNIKKEFEAFNLKFTAQTDAAYGLFNCEYLVANTGAVLLSSNQISEKKLSELPYNLVVVARTSQLIETLGEGLRRIKAREEVIPTNITTIKNFSDKADMEGHFMSYGSVAKNIYLLLLEDL